MHAVAQIAWRLALRESGESDRRGAERREETYARCWPESELSVSANVSSHRNHSVAGHKV
jgi:hypothetical protein